MVRAWYMNDSEADQRLDNQMDPPNAVDIATLTKTTGVLYFQVGSVEIHFEPLVMVYYTMLARLRVI